MVNNLYWAQGIAFVVVLVGFYWGVRLLAYVLQRVLYHLYLDVLDRLLGAFFAFLKGCLILGLALLFLGVFLPKNSHLIQESRLRPALTQLAKRTLDLLPPDFKEQGPGVFPFGAAPRGEETAPRRRAKLDKEMSRQVRGGRRNVPPPAPPPSGSYYD